MAHGRDCSTTQSMDPAEASSKPSQHPRRTEPLAAEPAARLAAVERGFQR